MKPPTSKDELIKSILSIKDWRHPYDFGGGRNTELAKSWYKEWHPWRLNTDIQNLDTILGGIEGKRVFDVACNDGYYGFAYSKRGAKVIGIDAREDAINRAALIREYFGFNNILHVQGDLQELRYSEYFNEPVDLTLFYGILYHLSNPVETLQNIGSITSKAIAVQTFIHGTEREPVLKLKDEETDLPGMGTTSLVCTPSQSAVVKMLNYAGFNMVLRVCPYPYLAASIATGSRPNWHWAFFYGIKASPEESERIRLQLHTVKTNDVALKQTQIVEIDAFTPPLNPYGFVHRTLDHISLRARNQARKMRSAFST